VEATSPETRAVKLAYLLLPAFASVLLAAGSSKADDVVIDGSRWASAAEAIQTFARPDS
jgi:hypothetical protein